MNLKYIEFTLENCDLIIIDGKYVCEFLVDDIHTSFERTSANSIEKCDVAETFAIEIHKDANKVLYQHSFGNDETFKRMIFDRLCIPDICSIRFVITTDDVREFSEDIGENDQEYFYRIKWETSEHWEINDLQLSYVSELGHMYIVISKSKKFEDIFNLENINNEVDVDCRFDMCDVGDEYSDPNRYTKYDDDEDDDN